MSDGLIIKSKNILGIDYRTLSSTDVHTFIHTHTYTYMRTYVGAYNTHTHAHTHTHTLITLHARATYFSTRGRHTLRQISGNIEAKNKCVG